MVKSEMPKAEEPEAIENGDSEKAVENAVAAVENKDAADPVTSSEWAKKAGGFFRKSKKIAGWTLLGLITIIPTLLFQLTKKMIEQPKSPESWLSSGKKEGKK